MNLPRQHAEVLDAVRRSVSQDDRFLGLAAGGSLLSGAVDRYSDLDLVVVVADDHHHTVMEQRHEIAAAWGTLLAAFTGEHVGEPRLLICLYADPLVHVDLKFLRADELAHRIEDPLVLWERGDVVTRVLARTKAQAPAFDPQWVEARFWIWVHYAAMKLGRGELFEVLDFLTFVRGQVLAPLALHVRGLPPRGVRRLEQQVPELVPALAGTVATHDRDRCAAAVLRSVELYRELRGQLASPLQADAEVEETAVRYLEEVVHATGAA